MGCVFKKKKFNLKISSRVLKKIFFVYSNKRKKLFQIL